MKNFKFFALTFLHLFIFNTENSVLLAGVVVIPSKAKNETPVIPRAPKPDYFNANQSHPLGVRPDCSEKKGSVSLLEDLARKPEINDINSFLTSIPEGMFQTFTLVTNSRSAQRGEGDEIVSEEWPRVLRTTADGKITFSYTCNPKSVTHNTVEVMYFDDKTKKTKTVSINLNSKDPQKRVHHDDKKCLACHGTVLPDGSTGAKYIWPEYFQWGGCDGKDTINLYGSNDDNMNASDFRAPFMSHE